MSGINYDLTKIKAFVFDIDGVLSPSTIPLDKDGYPQRMANIKDGFAIQLAAKKGYKIAVITGGKNKGIENRFLDLGLKDLFFNVTDKLKVMQEWLALINVEKQEVLYMGDDIPDLPCLRNVGLPCCPYDAVWEVKLTSKYVSKFSGGYGCVRDVMEQVLKAQNNWLNEMTDFSW